MSVNVIMILMNGENYIMADLPEFFGFWHQCATLLGSCGNEETVGRLAATQKVLFIFLISFASFFSKFI